MTNFSENLIVTTDVGFGNVTLPNDGQPMQVKVSQVKTENKPMTAEQIDAAKTHINNTVALADSVLDISKGLLEENEDAKSALNAIQGVGDIIKGVVKFIPGAPNPMVEKLQNLEKKIEKLGDKMSEHFSEIKMFITDVKFSVKIVTPTLVLNGCMADCMRYPGPESAQNFKTAYKKHSPLRLAYTFMSYLEQKATNPLRMAMEVDKVKSITKFRKWEDMFSRILTQFWILEAFATGLLGINNHHNLDILRSRTEEVLDEIEEWREDYENDEGYWEEVKAFLKDYIPKNSHLGNQEKARKIAEKLETYLTSDAFHICVFNQSTHQKDYTYHCSNESTQMIAVWNQGGCNAFIYRSRQGYFLEDDAYEEIVEQVEACMDRKLSIPYTVSMENIIQQQALASNQLRGDGLIFLIDMNCAPVVEVANSPDHDKGPGHWEQIEMHVNVVTVEEDLTNKMLIVSLP